MQYINVHIPQYTAHDTGSNHVLLQWSGLEAGMCEYSALQLALFTVRCALNIVYIMRGVMCTVYCVQPVCAHYQSAMST